MEYRKPEVVTPPTQEPLTVAEAKSHLFIAASDTTHDEKIAMLIQAAREQWEADTDSCVLTQTLRIQLEQFPVDDEIELPKRPIQSVTSIQYYDGTETLTTLSTSVYSLDTAEYEIKLKRLQLWPTVVLDRWDAVTVTYVAGYTSRELVPSIAKQAMLLLVGYYFEQRGDADKTTDMRAYESLVLKFMRSSYP